MPNDPPFDRARRSLLRAAAFAATPCRRILPLPWLDVVGSVRAAGSLHPEVPEFRRGIGVVHALGWADVTPDGSYVFPPFAGPHRDLSLDQVRVLRGAGFDFIRLAVDPGPFLHFRGAQRAWLDARLLDVVRAALDGGLGVIVDFHPSGMNAAYLPRKVTESADTIVFGEFLALVQRTARYLETLSDTALQKGRRARLALEILNEPEVSPASWQPMLDAAYRAARTAAPGVPLVIGGGLQNSADALDALDLTLFRRDPNLIYTFHDYTPWQFTHQGVEGNPAFPFTNVPYPPRRDLIENSKIATRQHVRASTHAPSTRSELAARTDADLNQYAKIDGEEGHFLETFDRVSAWCSANAVLPKRILLGEFGVHVTAYHRTAEGALARGRWFREMRQAAEARGFGWSVWDYFDSGGFGIAEDRTGLTLDRTVLDALGLRDPSNR